MTTTESDLEKSSISQRYVYDDLNPSTIEIELEEILRFILLKKFKTVFVIDELDKIEVQEVSLFFASLKGLFNRLSSLFIFVSGEEFFSTYEIDVKSFKIAHTIFSQKIYLDNPPSEEIFQYIDKITSKKT